MCTTSDLSPPYTNDGTTEQTTDRTTIDREIYVVCRYCLILLSVCAVASENNDFLYFTFYWFPFISLCWNLSPASIAITKNERHNSTEDEGKNRNWIKKHISFHVSNSLVGNWMTLVICAKTIAYAWPSITMRTFVHEFMQVYHLPPSPNTTICFMLKCKIKINNAQWKRGASGINYMRKTIATA